MKKIINAIFLFALLIFVNECSGYKPIFSSLDLNFEIEDYSIEGDKSLGNKIYNKLYTLSKSKKNDQDTKSITLLINASKNKSATAKDSSGKTLEYKIILNTEVEATDIITDDKIFSQSFSYSATYKVQKQYSETIYIENQSIENLMDQTYQDLLIAFSQNALIK